ERPRRAARGGCGTGDGRRRRRGPAAGRCRRHRLPPGASGPGSGDHAGRARRRGAAGRSEPRLSRRRTVPRPAGRALRGDLPRRRRDRGEPVLADASPRPARDPAERAPAQHRRHAGLRGHARPAASVRRRGRHQEAVRLLRRHRPRLPAPGARREHAADHRHQHQLLRPGDGHRSQRARLRRGGGARLRGHHGRPRPPRRRPALPVHRLRARGGLGRGAGDGRRLDPRRGDRGSPRM
ncbi:MAG: hypothetical protein AVDCRST_MAG08-2745, partial [uncultured Acetobacteraceae bacterium]